MLLTLLVRMLIMVLTLLIVVPTVTNGGVMVRQGGIFRGLLSLFVIGIFNCCLWLCFGLFTLGGAVVADFLLFGLVGLCINALAFKLANWLMPEVLYVRGFGSAFWASAVLTFVAYLIQHVVIR